MFVTNCGATTSYVTQVAILPIGEGVTGRSGYVFAATTDHGKASEGPGGGPFVRVIWADPMNLTVLFDRRAAVFKKDATQSGVSVRYAFVD